MVLKSDQERIKALLKDTITLLCRNGLTFKTEFSIEALIGITLDQDDVLLVNINEIVRTELGTKLAAAQASGQHADLGGGDDWNEEDSEEDGVPQSPSNSSNSKRRRKRRRSSGQTSKADGFDSDGGSGNSITGAEDSSLTEPPIKRSQVGITSRMKNSVKEEREDDEDSKDIVFIKEEMDSGDWASTSQVTDHNFPSDLSAIPSGSGTLQHQQQHDNFDFLQGNSLVPMSASSQQNANLWSEMTGRQNIMSPASKRTSTVTSNPAGPIGDESQQSLTPETIKTNAGLVEQILGSFGGQLPGLSPRALYNIIPSSLQPSAMHESSPSNVHTFSKSDSSDMQDCSSPKIKYTSDQLPDSSISHTIEAIKEEPHNESVLSSKEPSFEDQHTQIDFVASNVEVQHVNDTPFPSVMERLQESQELEQETFAGVRLPSRREFSDSSFRVKCPVCDKTFSTYQGYMRHVDQHRGRYAFHCTICNRGFMTKDHLGNHLRKHTGEKIYCFCGLGFKSHQSLRSHKKRDHPDNSFT